MRTGAGATPAGKQREGDRALGSPVDQIRGIARACRDEPFARRTWSELLFFVRQRPAGRRRLRLRRPHHGCRRGPGHHLHRRWSSSPARCRGAPGDRRLPPRLARSLPRRAHRGSGALLARPGFLGWLQSALRDRVGWRAVAYSVVKIPLSVFGVWFAFSVWVDAFFCLVYPHLGARGDRAARVRRRREPLPPGLPLGRRRAGSSTDCSSSSPACSCSSLAPWTMRAVVYLDRRLMRVLLAPDAMTARVRSLEQARAQTVDASAATLRRIERDLHDGTQAQLVALAMRLGQAKEKLADGGPTLDLDQVRRLVDDAHQGAKEAIVELRDLARGIHPPALDIGLEGALSTLAARSTVPTELTVVDRPTAHAGHRGDRLLLRGRAPGQRRPARPGLAGEHQLRPARPAGCASSSATTAGGSAARAGSARRRAGWSG